MKKLLFILFCVYTIPLFGTTPQHKRYTLNYQGDIDYTPQVREILATNPGGNFTLEFGEGVYKFFPEKASGSYMRVSNNDNGYKHIAFQLQNMEHVHIKGQNTELMFYGSIVPFYVLNSDNISLSGIDIDYDTSFIFEGEVLANNPEDRSIDLKVAEGVKYRVKADRLLFSGYDWEEGLGQNIVFTAQTKSPYYNTSKYLHREWENELKAKDLGDNIVRLYDFASEELPPVGSIYIDKGLYLKNRVYPGIVLEESSNISLYDMNIYMAGAMSLIGQTTENVTMKKFNVRLRPGSTRYISASADATHFVNCKGLISFEDCVFENMLDDATNVHGTYMRIMEKLSDTCMAVNFGHEQQIGFPFVHIGDTLQIIDRGSLLGVETLVVSDVEIVNDNYYLIYSSKAIKTTIADRHSFAVENRTNSAAVHMKNCIVRNNRARSILLSTPKPVWIEGNYFDSMMAGILIAGDANNWYESGGVGEITIRNNTFVNMGVGGETPQSILQISPIIPEEERTKGYYHGKIVFEENTIKTFDSQVIYALSVKELIVRNNRFIQTKDFAPLFDNLAYLDFQNCGSVEVYANTYEGENKAVISVIQTPSVKVEKQKGFEEEIANKPNTHFYQQ